MWHVVVPLDQRGQWTRARNHLLVERPHGVSDWRAMRVDEERRARVVGLHIVPREMNFPYELERKRRKIIARQGTVVRARHEHVVDVEQKPAAGSRGDFAEKPDFGDRAFYELHIG